MEDRTQTSSLSYLDGDAIQTQDEEQVGVGQKTTADNIHWLLTMCQAPYMCYLIYTMQQTYEVGTTMLFILRVRKLRPRSYR